MANQPVPNAESVSSVDEGMEGDGEGVGGRGLNGKAFEWTETAVLVVTLSAAMLFT